MINNINSNVIINQKSKNVKQLRLQKHMEEKQE